MRSRTLILLCAATCIGVAVLAVLVSLFNVGGDKENDITLCASGLSSFSSLPYCYGVEKGIFRRYGLNVTLTVVNDAYTASVLFLTGKSDFEFPSPGMAAAMYEEGERFRIAMALKTGSDFMVMVQPGIVDLEDLKGKSLGVIGRNSDAFRIMSWYLEGKGINIESDLELVEISNPGALSTSFISGQLDAAVLWSAYAAKALASGKVQLIDCSEALEEIIGYPAYISIAIVRDETIERKPAVKEFLRALREICREINENREEAARIWAEFSGQSVEDIGPIMQMMDLIGDLDEDIEEGILAFYRYGVERGAFTDAPSESKVFYTDWR